jgi:hypothetical protein
MSFESWCFENIFFFLFMFLFDTRTCQVAIEVEREEDEGGTAGETFTDYVSIISKCFLQNFCKESLCISELLACVLDFGYRAVEFS